MIARRRPMIPQCRALALAWHCPTALVLSCAARCGAVNVFYCVAACRTVAASRSCNMVALCCSRVALCCSMLYCVAPWSPVLQHLPLVGVQGVRTRRQSVQVSVCVRHLGDVPRQVHRQVRPVAFYTYSIAARIGRPHRTSEYCALWPLWLP